MNLSGVDAAAGAFAAVVTALVATGTLYLQWRSMRRVAAAGDRGTSVSPGNEERPPAVGRRPGVASDAAHEVAGDDVPAKKPSERWLTPRRIAFPSLSGIAAGLIVVVVAAWLFGNSHSSVQIISPRRGTAVSQQNGFQASGTSRDLGNDTLWLADYDGTGYTIDSEATIRTGGSWTASDSDLGNPGQALPFALTARVIVADAQCTSRMQVAMNSNQDYLTSLPGGCEVAGAVTVEVTTR